jgi:hypothetical protein
MTDLYDIAYGTGGLWEVHRWTSASGVVFDLNVQDVTEGATVDQIAGLHSLPDHEDPRAKRVGRTGENPTPRSFGGKTITYTGEIRGASLPLMRLTRTQMLAAFADLRIGTMELLVHADAGGPTGQFSASVLELDPPDVQSSNYYRRSYTLGLRLNDPRVYFPSLAVDESDSSAAAVTNPGTAPADPVVTITGASGDVTLTDGTRVLTFTDVPSGTLVVDFAARTAKVGSAHAPLVVAASDWWDSFVDGIAPDTTVTIEQTGGTGVQVEFVPAVW